MALFRIFIMSWAIAVTSAKTVSEQPAVPVPSPLNLNYYVQTLNQLISGQQVTSLKNLEEVISGLKHLSPLVKLTSLLNLTSLMDNVHLWHSRLVTLTELTKLNGDVADKFGFLADRLNVSVAELDTLVAEAFRDFVVQQKGLERSIETVQENLEDMSSSISKLHNMTITTDSPDKTCTQTPNPHAFIEQTRLQSAEEPASAPFCLLELIGFGMDDTGYTRRSSTIKINGESLDIFDSFLKHSSGINSRGLHTVTLNFHDNACYVGQNYTYDTWVSGPSVDLNNKLKQFQPGTIIAGVSNDEFTYNLAPANETLKSQFGISLQTVGRQWGRSAAVFVGVKGDPSRAKVIQLPRKTGPAVLRIDWLDEMKFSPWGKGFTRYPRLKFVGIQFTMVTAPTSSEQDCVTRCAVSRGCKTVNVLQDTGRKLCQMFTARWGYPNTSLGQDENSVMLQLTFIP